VPSFIFPHERAVVTKTSSMRKAGFMYGFFLMTGADDFSWLRVSEVGSVEVAVMIPVILPSGIEGRIIALPASVASLSWFLLRNQNNRRPKACQSFT
jgi:hypothetical protein